MGNYHVPFPEERRLLHWLYHQGWGFEIINRRRCAGGFKRLWRICKTWRNSGKAQWSRNRVNSIHARFNLTCQSTLNCSALKICSVVGFSFAGFNKRDRTLPATQLNLKPKPLKYQLVVSVLTDPQTFNFALSQQSPSIFCSFKRLTQNVSQVRFSQSWLGRFQMTSCELFYSREVWARTGTTYGRWCCFHIWANSLQPQKFYWYQRLCNDGASGSFSKVKLDDRRVEFILPELCSFPYNYHWQHGKCSCYLEARSTKNL